MKTGGVIFGLIIAVLIALGAWYMIDIDQTQEARMPEVSVEGGQAPKYEMNTGEVNVTEEKRTVTVPDVDVEMEEKEVTVPGIEVKPAQE